MGSSSNLLHNVIRGAAVGAGDPAGFFLARKNDLAYNYFKPKEPPPVIAAPNVSTAANLAQQQDDLRNRQRGVLSNIFAGNNAPPPTVATGTVLGG